MRSPLTVATVQAEVRQGVWWWKDELPGLCWGAVWFYGKEGAYLPRMTISRNSVR